MYFTTNYKYNPKFLKRENRALQSLSLSIRLIVITLIPKKPTFASAQTVLSPCIAGRKVRATQGTMLPNGKAGENLQSCNRE